MCLRVCIAVKRHHDHGNSYKGKHLMEVTVSEVQSIIIMVGSMAGGPRHGVGEIAESSTS